MENSDSYEVLIKNDSTLVLHLKERISDFCTPMTPIETDIEITNTLTSFPGFFLFDIYGTLLISQSGDIGIDDDKTLKETESENNKRIIHCIKRGGFDISASNAGSVCRLKDVLTRNVVLRFKKSVLE